MPKIKNSAIDKVINQIIDRNESIRNFWSDAKGWAPIESAALLSKSRLDWQVSLSNTLRIWATKPPPYDINGCLILAWTNLGSLVEGTMKLFLSVHYEDYKSDIDAIKKKNGKLLDPDGLMLEPMRQFFLKKKILNKKWDRWIQYIQQRRNAIHAYKNRSIETFKDFFKNLKKYLEFLEEINNRLPYPEDL